MEEKEQLRKYYIDVPVHVELVDCYSVIAPNPQIALQKFEDGKDVVPLDTEPVGEERGKPQVTGWEKIK